VSFKGTVQLIDEFMPHFFTQAMRRAKNYTMKCSGWSLKIKLEIGPVELNHA